MWARVGEAAADVYEGWAFFLLLGCLGLHLLVAVGYVVASKRPLLARGYLLVEFVYGFLNPAVYLVVFQPAIFRRFAPEWLTWLCWLTFTAYWGARVFGGGRTLGGVPARGWVRGVMHLVTALIPALFLRDLVATAWSQFYNVPLGLVSLPLYVIPFLASFRQLAATESEENWRRSDFFLLAWRPRWIPFVLISTLVLGAGALLPGASEAEARALILENHDTIVRVSRERNLDPRLLASIVLVTQRELTSPFRSKLEDSIADAWLTDATSHTLLAEAFDPSLGIAQVKAHTVLTGLFLLQLSGPNPPTYLPKQYRSVRAISGEVLDRVPSPALQQVKGPVREPWPDKRVVVSLLRTPEGNLAAAAFLLDLVATQWESTDPRWSIRARPDVMATLFQLGFERSVPKADPRSNAFGNRVAESFRGEWMEAHFGGR